MRRAEGVEGVWSERERSKAESDPDPDVGVQNAGAANAYAALDDRELVLAMRRDEERAFVEFVARFHARLLQQAKVARVPPEDRDALVLEVLGDMAERLTSPSVRAPRSLVAYLVTSLHHRAVNAHRERTRRSTMSTAASAELDTHHEHAVLHICSEASVRASHGAAWEPSPVRPALSRLAAALEQELSDDERRIVAWLAEQMTQRQIATWLGIGFAAAAKRVTRLRARLRKSAAAYIATRDPEERRELEEFFHRIGGGEDR